MEYGKQRKLKAIVRSFVFAFRIFASRLRLIGALRFFAIMYTTDFILCICVVPFRSVHLLCKQSERKQIRIFVFNHSLQQRNLWEPNGWGEEDGG